MPVYKFTQLLPSSMENYTAPSLFLPHGGGPMPLLDDPAHYPMNTFLNTTARQELRLLQAAAIIVITAHWEWYTVSISSGKRHHLYYDYYNFPAVSYTWKYEAPGAPQLARRVHRAFIEAGVESRLDPDRGWDHGVFVPMMLLRPEADIPILQISVNVNQDANEHWKIGEALRPFRDEGIIVLGSGMSYHNMRHLRSIIKGDILINEPFDGFLVQAALSEGKERQRLLVGWTEAPGGLEAHPHREAEHFMPLVVAAAAGGDAPGRKIFNWDLEGVIRLRAFIWN